MSERGVYLYKITLSKEGEDPLYYFGIRFGYEGNPEDDDYMGSPHTYKAFWQDPSYTKTKDILEVGTFSNTDELRNFANTEIKIIQEAWDQYGPYGKGGRCLNAQAGRVFIHTKEVREEIARKQSEYWTGNPLHPMKRPDHRKRKAEEMKRLFTEHPEKNPNNLPSVKEKQRQRMLKHNPMHNPEIAAKVKGENNPMYGKKHTDEQKQQIAMSVRSALSKPEVREKLSQTSKDRWLDPSYKERMSQAQKRRWEKLRKGRVTNTLENYFD